MTLYEDSKSILTSFSFCDIASERTRTIKEALKMLNWDTDRNFVLISR